MTELMSAKQLSKTLFNRENRLTVWHAVMQKNINPPEPFRGKEIHEEFLPHANRGEIGVELRALAAINAIILVPGPAGDNHSKYFCRVESAIWPLVEELAGRTIELSSQNE